MRGYLWAIASIVMVSAAQLLLRWAMQRLPGLTEMITLSAHINLQPALILLIGLGAYSLSMLCWIMALSQLPLSRVYPLLSISYVLVWLLAISLPAFDERFHWRTFAGVIAIVLGLLLVTVPVRKKS